MSAIGGVFVRWEKSLTLRDVQLNHPRAFFAVADLGSYTRATCESRELLIQVRVRSRETLSQGTAGIIEPDRGSY